MFNINISSRARRGDFILYFSYDNGCFPQKNWTDLPATIRSWQSYFGEDGVSKKLFFMGGGPYYFDVIRHNSGFMFRFFGAGTDDGEFEILDKAYATRAEYDQVAKEVRDFRYS